MARFYADPLGFVLYAFPWDTDKSLQLVKLPEPWRSQFPNCEYGPDAWACEELEAIGAAVRERGFDGAAAVAPIRRAVVSGHGIGKSAIVAWITCWIMSTRPFAQGTVTATTAPQLRTKTWAQIAKWAKKCVTSHWFNVTTGMGTMRMEHKAHQSEWFCQAQTCAEENSEAFAGQHAANSTSFYIFDEASGVPNKIDEVSEGGLTDGEPMKFAFGNPTQNSGWFYDAFHRMRHRWSTRHVDSRDVQITNKKLIDEWISDHGIDSDWIKIRVRGMFPAQSSRQFISVADVDAAMARHLRPEQYAFAPKVLTLDNAWTGDDEGVIGLRQGLKFTVLRTFVKNDNDIEIANLLARLEDEEGADAVFIDAGYGTGVYSAGVTMGREWQLVWFAGKSPDPGYLNMRAWIWGQTRDWLKKGGALPEKDLVLHDDLIGPQTVPRMDGVIQLESKEDMKKRDVASPNRADALALSFAYPVARRDPYAKLRRKVAPTAGHDPYAPEVLQPATVDHDPYA
jgi:hypothetical protein